MQSSQNPQYFNIPGAGRKMLIQGAKFCMDLGIKPSQSLYFEKCLGTLFRS